MSNPSRVAIVTGASDGIGKEITRQLVANNYTVVLLSRSVDKMQQLSVEMTKQGGQVLAIACDIAQADDITRAVMQVKKELGCVSVLVNNAGFGGPAQRITDLSLAEWDYIFAVNVRGAFLLIQHVLPAMEQMQFGRIINISSILGLTGSENSSAYTASKHALVGLTRSIAAEYGAFGITCNAICPGYINTGMLATNSYNQGLIERIAMKRLGTSLEIAQLVAMLAGEQSYYLNGSIITADGGLSCRI